MQHTLNELLVFGRSKGGYWKALGITYLTYSVSLAISPFINSLLINSLGASHSVAWFGTLASTGLLNFFTVSKFCAPNDGAAGKGE